MKTKQLIEIFKQFPPNSNVSLCFWTGEGTEVGDIEMVADNAGPSIYAMGWRSGDDSPVCPKCGSTAVEPIR